MYYDPNFKKISNLNKMFLAINKLYNKTEFRRIQEIFNPNLKLKTNLTPKFLTPIKMHYSLQLKN